MWRVLSWVTVGLMLAAWPVDSAAQGKSGKVAPPGKSAEHRMDERGHERAENASQGTGESREHGDAHGRPEHAASESPGFFENVRRFFGFGRSEEASEGRVNESAQSRERARDQYGGPDDD